jgi:hypothetical protein
MTLPLQHETRAGSNTSSRQPTLPHPRPAMQQAHAAYARPCRKRKTKKEDRDAGPNCGLVPTVPP